MVMKIDGEADGLSLLLAALKRKPVITDHDIRELRHALYDEAPIDRRLAAEIFHTNRILPIHSDAWTEFYLEALSDFFLEQDANSPILRAPSEALLLGWLGDDVMIDDRAERRLVQRLLLRAEDVSERFESYVLDAIGETLLHQNERWLCNGEREASVVDALDRQLIQRTVDRFTRGEPGRVTRVGARFLLRLDRQAFAFEEPETWRSFLVQSVVHHMRSVGDSGSGMTNGGIDERNVLEALLDVGCEPDQGKRLRDDIISVITQGSSTPSRKARTSGIRCNPSCSD